MKRFIRPLSLLVIPALATPLACSDDGNDGSVFTTTDSSSITAGDGDGDSLGGDGDGDGDGDSGDGDGDSGDGDGDGDGDDPPKLDVGPDTGTAEGGQGEGCSFVDVVFVIDNSASMGDYQNALGLAFPQFAQTLADALPEGTNVHVGVTSTEMGYASSGSTSINNGVCVFEGDGGLSEEGFYITPLDQNTGKNGAQGRLYKPGGNGEAFYAFDTDDAGQIQGAATWFASAAAIGTGGSNIEMLTAPAGWFAHEANAGTNAGFLRDEGAVTVVFFMQDEPDQTPMEINGQPGGLEMLDMLAAEKAGCGGVDCILAGGFLNDNACGGRPIDDFLDSLTEPPQVAPLPDDNLAEDNPQAAADEMNELLSDTLAAVISQKCDEIPPVD